MSADVTVFYVCADARCVVYSMLYFVNMRG